MLPTPHGSASSAFLTACSNDPHDQSIHRPRLPTRPLTQHKFLLVGRPYKLAVKSFTAIRDTTVLFRSLLFDPKHHTRYTPNSRSDRILQVQSPRKRQFGLHVIGQVAYGVIADQTFLLRPALNSKLRFSPDLDKRRNRGLRRRPLTYCAPPLGPPIYSGIRAYESQNPARSNNHNPPILLKDDNNNNKTAPTTTTTTHDTTIVFVSASCLSVLFNHKVQHSIAPAEPICQVIACSFASDLLSLGPNHPGPLPNQRQYPPNFSNTCRTSFPLESSSASPRERPLTFLQPRPRRRPASCRPSFRTFFG